MGNPRTVIFHLQHRRAATAAELAELAEVSVRTVYRDIAALQAAGVPLWTETGPHGGVRLLEGWQSSVAGLTADEAGILALAGVPGVAEDLGMGTALAAAEVKLLAGLAPEQQGRARRVRARFHADVGGWARVPEDLSFLAVLAEAVTTDRRVDLVYRTGRPGSQPFRRRMDPFGLVVKAGAWYLVGRHRNELRSYRVSRVQQVTVRDESFARPDNFDLAAWWAASNDDFDRSMLRATARLRLSPAALRRLPYVVPGQPTREAVGAAGPPDDEGWCEVVVGIESEPVALHQLRGLGAEVECSSRRACGRRLLPRVPPSPPDTVFSAHLASQDDAEHAENRGNRVRGRPLSLQGGPP